MAMSGQHQNTILIEKRLSRSKKLGVMILLNVFMAAKTD